MEITEELGEELKNDISVCINDIKDKLEKNEKVPKFTLSGLLSLTSNVVSLSSIAAVISKLCGIG